MYQYILAEIFPVFVVKEQTESSLKILIVANLILCYVIKYICVYTIVHLQVGT